jgi:hypothetical protein
MAIRAAARWFSEDSAKVYVNAAGQLFSRDTGSVTITLGLAGATVSRRVRVPAPSLVFSLSAATDTLRLATPLTLTSRLHLNGWLVNFDELADHAMVDSLTPRWTSLDTVTILPPVQVSPAGLVSFSPERLRTTIDSVRISARVKAFGVTAQDTLLFYLPAVAPTPPDAILHALPDDLLLPGQTIEIFSIDGKPVRTLRPHRLYLIRTPRGVTKLQLRE